MVYRYACIHVQILHKNIIFVIIFSAWGIRIQHRCDLLGISSASHCFFFKPAHYENGLLLTSTFFTCRLDPALIRPGRVDFIKEIGHCTNWQLQRMFSRFYPEADAAQLSEFATEIEKISHPVSPAMIQGHFMYHKVWPNGACFGGHVACFCGLIVHYLGRK